MDATAQLLEMPAQSGYVIRIYEDDRRYYYADGSVKQINDLVELPLHVPEPVPEPKVRYCSKKVFIYFKFNSYAVLDRDRVKDYFVSIRDRVEQVKVSGYTDRIGSKKYNDRLALKRAKSVKSVLEEAGIPECSATGQGKCCYISGIDAFNRRAEVNLTLRCDENEPEFEKIEFSVPSLKQSQQKVVDRSQPDGSVRARRYLMLYEGTTHGSRTVAVIPSGASVRLLKKSGEFCHIEYRGFKGYVVCRGLDF